MTLAGLRFPAIADIEDGTERHALRAQYTQSGSDFFMIACARSGKYSGVQAIGVGSNKDKREKACKVAFCLRALASTKDFAKCGDLALQPSVEKVQQLLAPFGATAPSSCNVASSVSCSKRYCHKDLPTAFGRFSEKCWSMTWPKADATFVSVFQ